MSRSHLVELDAMDVRRLTAWLARPAQTLYLGQSLAALEPVEGGGLLLVTIAVDREPNAMVNPAEWLAERAAFWRNVRDGSHR